MNNVIYLDVLDTVKMTGTEALSNYAVAEASLKAYSLFSPTPVVLTQSQLIDSAVIINVLNKNTESDAFLDLIKNDRVRVSLDGQNSLISALDSALSRGVTSGGNMFRFSGLKMMEDGSETDKRIKRKEILQYIANHFSGSLDNFEDSDKEILERQLNSLRKIDIDIKNRFLYTTHGANDKPLSVYTKEFIDNGISEGQNDFNNQALNLLRDAYMDIEFKNARSAYYTYFENHADDRNKSLIKACKDIVDSLYNLVVGASITSLNKIVLTNELDRHTSTLSKTLSKVINQNIVSDEQDLYSLSQNQANNSDDIRYDNNIIGLQWNDVFTALKETELFGTYSRDRAKKLIQYCDDELHKKLSFRSNGVRIICELVVAVLEFHELFNNDSIIEKIPDAFQFSVSLIPIAHDIYSIYNDTAFKNLKLLKKYAKMQTKS
jgi:hypothetical protein